MLQLQAALAALSRLSTLEIVGLQALALLLFIWLMVKIFRRRSDETTESVAQVIEPIVAKSPVAPVAAPSPAPVAELKTSPSAVISPTESGIPEDSVLHRHYLANQEAERLARTEPYPSESVLHRHYDTAHCLHLDADAPAAPVAKSASKCGCSAEKSVIPQDSVLRRHFLSQLQAEVESRWSPAPSDSVLRRHYQAMVAAEMASRLAACQS